MEWESGMLPVFSHNLLPINQFHNYKNVETKEKDAELEVKRLSQLHKF